MTVVNPVKEEIKNQTDDSIIKGKSAKSEPELKKTKSSFNFSALKKEFE